MGEVGLDTLKKPVEMRHVRDVGVLRLAGTTNEETPDTSVAVNDDGAGTDGDGGGVGNVTKDTLALFALILRDLVVELVKGFDRCLLRQIILYLRPLLQVDVLQFVQADAYGSRP
jgi:hypothetical protein